MPIKIYEYAKCSTCRKALKFLERKGISYEAVPIAEKPPTEAELGKMLERVGGELRKLFNTSGQAYRELGLSEKLKSMTREEALKLLASNGKLVKRPLLLRGNDGLVGFDEAQWLKFFKS